MPIGVHPKIRLDRDHTLRLIETGEPIVEVIGYIVPHRPDQMRVRWTPYAVSIMDKRFNRKTFLVNGSFPEASAWNMYEKYARMGAFS